MSRVIETEPCGLLFDFDDPRPEQVDIRDIARSLSLSCRFGGLCRRFYSVAEHALLVHRLVKDAGFPPDVCYAALHHDSHETYLGDMPSPLKLKVKELAPGAWEWLQAEVDDAICQQLGINYDLLNHDAIKAADAMALQIEAAVLKGQHGHGPKDNVPWNNDAPASVPAWLSVGNVPTWSETNFLAAHREARWQVVAA